jgi:hypothetical protein
MGLCHFTANYRRNKMMLHAKTSHLVAKWNQTASSVVNPVCGGKINHREGAPGPSLTGYRRLAPAPMSFEGLKVYFRVSWGIHRAHGGIQLTEHEFKNTYRRSSSLKIASQVGSGVGGSLLIEPVQRLHEQRRSKVRLLRTANGVYVQSKRRHLSSPTAVV